MQPEDGSYIKIGNVCGYVFNTYTKYIDTDTRILYDQKRPIGIGHYTILQYV